MSRLAVRPEDLRAVGNSANTTHPHPEVLLTSTARPECRYLRTEDA